MSSFSPTRLCPRLQFHTKLLLTVQAGVAAPASNPPLTFIDAVASTYDCCVSCITAVAPALCGAYNYIGSAQICILSGPATLNTCNPSAVAFYVEAQEGFSGNYVGTGLCGAVALL